MGYSGDCYDDQKEVSWKHITEAAGANMAIVEYTTVTKRIRRVFSFSKKQFLESISTMGVTDICVMFADYIEASDYGKDDWMNLHENTREWIDNIRLSLDDVLIPLRTKMTLISTGPREDHIVDMESDHIAMKGGTFWTKKSKYHNI